jgi:hypothetical protein
MSFLQHSWQTENSEIEKKARQVEKKNILTERKETGKPQENSRQLINRYIENIGEC